MNMNKKMSENKVQSFAEEMLKRIFIEADLGMCDMKKMFGGFAISIDDNNFAIVTDLGKGPELYIKTSDDTEVEFIKNGSSKFSYLAKGSVREINYHSIPEVAYTNVEAFKHFINLGLAVSLEKKELELLEAKKKSSKINIEDFLKR